MNAERISDLRIWVRESGMHSDSFEVPSGRSCRNSSSLDRKERTDSDGGARGLGSSCTHGQNSGKRKYNPFISCSAIVKSGMARVDNGADLRMKLTHAWGEITLLSSPRV